MKTYNIFTNEEDSLPDTKADFLLATFATELTPTLDAEFITNEKVFSLINSTLTPKDISIFAFITRAVHNLTPFSSIEILDLGLKYLPQNTTCQSFSISLDSIDAKEVFKKGMNYGDSYELKGNYLIISESSPAETATLQATALALGYDFKTDKTKYENIQELMSLINDDMSRFEKLSLVSDSMLVFCAGFIMSASRRFHVVLAGGTRMAVCLLVADALREDVLMRVKSDNITLASTSWVVKNSNIKQILSLLTYTPHAVYTDFSFAKTEIDILKEHENQELKDTAGSGGALAYANANKISNEKLLEALEYVIYTL